MFNKLKRNKRIFTILTVIGLLAVLTTSVVRASTGFYPSSPNIVGTWKMKIIPSATSPEGLEVMQTFFADGNYLETININASTIGHGIWMGSGSTYFYTFQTFNYDENGTYIGKRVIRNTLTMDSPDHFTGHGEGDIIDLDGKVTKSAFSADIESTRMEMQLPDPTDMQ